MRRSPHATLIPARSWLALAALAVALAGLAGCGGPGATTKAAVTACQTGDMSLGVFSGDAASGRQRYVFSFSNGGQSACTLTGYPGVTGMGAGVAITQATSAYMWNTATITTLTLAPADVAFFAIQFQPTAEFSGQTCVTATPSFEPPGNSTGLASPVSVTTCDGTLSISPIVATPNDL